MRITTRDNNAEFKELGEEIDQNTYWFAQKDGRLLRVQRRLSFGSTAPAIDDLQVIKQDFAPQFSAQTWKFVPPAYAATAK